ncbi:MAG: phage head spike fiber domain-containing protein, partial [Niveispirillum sp.]|uniref:phage head spike fiber domain-containing protein n=1 Tax=Niveispirillum sp. TaxID=1917217 RepID=UPI003BA63286
MTRRARNVVIANNDFAAKDGTVLTSPTSFVAGMGLSNILNDRLKMVCRTIGNSVILDLDMGYPVPASLFMLLGHNFTAAARWRIRGARARSGAAGDVGGYNFALADTVYDTRGILASGTARGALSWTSTMLDHDLASGALPAGCTLTRASPGTYFDYTGTMRTAAAGEARFDYDPVTKAPLGLLIEETRTNLTVFSQQFTNAQWATPTNAVVTDNAAMAPDGTTTAATLIENSATDLHALNSPGFNFVAGTSYTISIFIRAIGNRDVELGFPDTVFASRFASFNLQAGAVRSADVGVTAAIQPVGGGVYRVSASATCAISAGARWAIFINTQAGSRVYTGDGASGVRMWGAQLEAGSVPTSYIATTSGAGTRQADVPTMPTSALPSFNAAAGTLIVSGRQVSDISGSAFPRFACLSAGSDANMLQWVVWAASDIVFFEVVTGSVQQASLSFSSYTGAATTLGAAWSANDFASAKDGVAGPTDSSGSIPAVTALNIGSNATGSSQLIGWISRITYIASRISNADLQTLTNPATSTATRAATLAPYAGTSGTTPITLGTGTKTVFVDDQGLRLYRGAAVQLAIDAGNYMRGPVTDYDRASGRLTVNVTSVVGSGSATSMTITREAADLSVWPSVDPFGLSYWGDFSWGGQIDLLGEGYSPPGVHMPGLANGDGQPVYARYFKIEVQDTSLSYLDIGRLVVAAAYQPTINMSWDWRIGWVDPSQRERSRGGQVYVDGRRQWRTASLQLANIPRTEMMSQMYELRRAEG